MEEVRIKDEDIYREGYRRGYRDGFEDASGADRPQAAERAPDAVTELPPEGEAMPSDADMLLYATPFFESEEEKKAQAAQDDADEEKK